MAILKNVFIAFFDDKLKCLDRKEEECDLLKIIKNQNA